MGAEQHHIRRAGAHRLITRVVTLSALATAAILAACADPVHDEQVRLLGDEVDGIPQGEYHRAGQPCLTCHGGIGPADARWSVAGTVFYGPKKQVGQDAVEILLVDSLGSSPRKKVLTNCVGNFHLTPDEWDPAFPIRVGIARGASTKTMNTHVSRDGSCAGCHKDPADYNTPGHVFLVGADEEAAKPAPVAECPVDPDLGGGKK